MSNDYEVSEADYTVIGILLLLVGFALTSVAIYDFTVQTSGFWNIIANTGINVNYQPYVKPEVVLAISGVVIIIAVGTLYAYRHKLFVKTIEVRA